MYIHWTHHYLPKIFAALSFILNPFFIILILMEKTDAIGRYRFLFLFFAIFDIVYSFVECLVPLVIHKSGGGFVAFVADGPFFQSEYSEDALALRSSFIGLSYGILVIHFMYRYLILYNPHIIDQVLKPLGLLCIFIFFILHSVIWFTICKCFLVANSELRSYIHDDILKAYQVESTEISFLIAMYYGVSPRVVWRSITGVFLLTCISIYAVSTYFILGFKIMKKLRETSLLSTTTSKLHNQLFKALVVQTAIPIFVSFLPCFCAWCSPMINLNLENWNNRFGVVSLAAFPALDPLAIMLLLTMYRNRIVKLFQSCFRKNVKVANVELVINSSGVK